MTHFYHKPGPMGGRPLFFLRISLYAYSLFSICPHYVLHENEPASHQHSQSVKMGNVKNAMNGN
jgi:hypothetical protein